MQVLAVTTNSRTCPSKFPHGEHHKFRHRLSNVPQNSILKRKHALRTTGVLHDQNRNPNFIQDMIQIESDNLKIKEMAVSRNQLDCGNNVVQAKHPLSILRSHEENDSPSNLIAVSSPLELAHAEIQFLREQLHSAELRTDIAISQIESQSQINSENQNRIQMAEEEINALYFENSIQQQRIKELEQSISSDRIDHNESSSNKARKHKAELKQLAKEKSEYEERANTMIQQMAEQMTTLQNMAMERIDGLETDLMHERHKYQEKVAECISLKAALHSLSEPDDCSDSDNGCGDDETESDHDDGEECGNDRRNDFQDDDA